MEPEIPEGAVQTPIYLLIKSADELAKQRLSELPSVLRPLGPRFSCMIYTVGSYMWGYLAFTLSTTFIVWVVICVLAFRGRIMSFLRWRIANVRRRTQHKAVIPHWNPK